MTDEILGAEKKSGFAAEAKAEKENLAVTIIMREAQMIANSILKHADMASAQSAVERINSNGMKMSHATKMLLGANNFASAIVDIPDREQHLYIAAIGLVVRQMVSAIRAGRADDAAPAVETQPEQVTA